MPEYDTSGPAEAAGPADPTRERLYRQWQDGYVSLQPLEQYLQMTPKQRGFNLATTSGFLPLALRL